MSKLLLLDGNSLTYRAFFALPPDMATASGQVTNAVFGFTSMLINLLRDNRPDGVIAAFDRPEPTFRHEVVIVTGDRDEYQLVEDPLVKVLYNRRGVSDYALYDEAGIEERTGVTPAEYVQYAAMRGDNSDNLPGVPGVGEKTAAKLIKKYGGLDGIFALSLIHI